MIGEGIDRVDGPAKAQGAVVYSGDLVLEGMVHAALVQSPISNGRIAALDAARATSLAGVLAVLHHANAPRLAPRGAGEMPLLLQDDRINYGGQPIAAVIAETLATARRAAGLVSMHAFGASFAEVAVHADLGEVRVRRFVACYGAGRILNAKMARSQQIGGIVFGIGMALGEATRLDAASGRITNARLTDYLLPVHADVPDIDVAFVAEDDPHVNATGVKGIGMIGAVGVAAAIANAVFHAAGVRVRDLPITPDKLL